MSKKQKKEEFSLATLQKDLSTNSADFLSQVQQEIVEEEQDSLKDFVKGAYRLIVEKERTIQDLQKEVQKIKEAIQAASSGNWEDLAQVKIPARFFKEEVLRKHGKSLINGSEEVRFLDLYVPKDEE